MAQLKCSLRIHNVLSKAKISYPKQKSFLIFPAKNFVRSVVAYSNSYKLHKYQSVLDIRHINSFFGVQRYYSSSSLPCWNCGHISENLQNFCNECTVIQPIKEDINYFDILGIKKAFNINSKFLTKDFRKLQSIYHPDKFGLKSPHEQELAADHSSMINKAYRTVLHPVERAEYLLQLAGLPLEEGHIDMDPEFLMDIMEVNEELEEAQDKDDVQEIGRKNQQILDGLLQEADSYFENENIVEARGVVAKIKYYDNIYNKIKAYERKHGILD
ncbi:unnamed protein product [Meganyctiphanes norvegica]|uniref:J domain-containing protein n=1 Tax=Meganyctiphanes norvegica TaxID=48144 RepID=A0AAV2RK11_MEGNR